MKINSINNNYKSQQSFGATGEPTYRNELGVLLRFTCTPQELVDFFRADKALAAQVPAQDVASRFRAIKAIGKNGQETDPLVGLSANVSQESTTAGYSVSIPSYSDVHVAEITKTKKESPKAFFDRFLDAIQTMTKGLEKPEDIQSAANLGLAAFFKPV